MRTACFNIWCMHCGVRWMEGTHHIGSSAPWLGMRRQAFMSPVLPAFSRAKCAAPVMPTCHMHCIATTEYPAKFGLIMWHNLRPRLAAGSLSALHFVSSSSILSDNGNIEQESSGVHRKVLSSFSAYVLHAGNDTEAIKRCFRRCLASRHCMRDKSASNTRYQQDGGGSQCVRQ